MRTRLVLTTVMVWTGCADHKVGVYNTPPELTILSPEAGASFDEGVLIEFDAVVRDSQDDSDELSVTWSSQVDGFLGDDPPSQSGEVYLGISELTVGEHVVTLTVLDTQGDSAQTSVNFSVGEIDDPDPDPEPDGSPPTVLLAGPVSGDIYELEATIQFVGKATDAEQDAITLSASLISSRDGLLWEGNPDEEGWIDWSSEELTAGEHIVTLHVVDNEGLKEMIKLRLKSLRISVPKPPLPIHWQVRFCLMIFPLRWKARWQMTKQMPSC